MGSNNKAASTDYEVPLWSGTSGDNEAIECPCMEEGRTAGEAVVGKRGEGSGPEGDPG